MNYRPIEKDLTVGTETCFFCNRPLRSLKAFVLENLETKEKVYSGPKCAKDNIDSVYSLRSIPDLTKFTLANNERESTSTNRNVNRRVPNLTDKELNLRTAIEYLELRENKLAKSFNTSYPQLKEYYIYYSEKGTLEENQIQHILNIERSTSENLKLLNLQKCYNYSFWLNIGIEKLRNNDDKFLVSIKSYLERKLEITEKQKRAVNRWLEKLDGVPQLK